MPKELYHFNKNHDELGRFAESPRSARAISRDLKRNEKQTAENRRQEKQNLALASRSRKLGRHDAAKEYEREAKRAAGLVKNGEQVAKQLIKEAESSGYQVSTKTRTKGVASKRYHGVSFVGTVLAGPIGSIAVSSIYQAATLDIQGVDYTKYKLREAN